MSEQPQGGYIRQAWLVIVLALVYGAALAGVQTTLGPRIAENKKRETYDVVPLLVEGADRAATRERLVEGAQGKSTVVYQAFSADGRPAGWVLPASGQGFADRIDLLIGLDVRLSAITGLYVLDQKETPGLGNLIAGATFRGRFRDKPTDRPLVIVTSDPTADNELQALTGATISSDSVATIVNDAIANYKNAILKLLWASPTNQKKAATMPARCAHVATKTQKTLNMKQ